MTHMLRRYLVKNPQERALLRRVAAVVLKVRLALWLFPWPRVRQLCAGWAQRKHDPHPASVEQIVKAVQTAVRYIPGAGNCLVQAMAAHTLLCRHGHAAELRIGVHREHRAADLAAHAWVEHQGRIVIGASHQPFTPLSPVSISAPNKRIL